MTATVQSVERAFTILETFDEEHPTRSAAEIAELAGLARPTTYRMLQTLQRLGYVRNVSGRYEVTPRVLRLGAGYLGRTSLAARAQPILDQLSEDLGEHAAIGTLDGDDVITLAASTTPQSRLLSIAIQVGQRMPADSTSLGRILLAYRPNADDADSVAIRNAGFVITDGLLESGLRSLGVPVRDRDGAVVASMSIGVNASRISVDDLHARCLPAMLRAADVLTHRL
jgi:IclR family transcriptional regulator, pca regulon regulatory protein